MPVLADRLKIVRGLRLEELGNPLSEKQGLMGAVLPARKSPFIDPKKPRSLLYGQPKLSPLSGARVVGAGNGSYPRKAKMGG